MCPHTYPYIYIEPMHACTYIHAYPLSIAGGHGPRYSDKATAAAFAKKESDSIIASHEVVQRGQKMVSDEHTDTQNAYRE
jgi:hypothetical protein